MMEHVDIAVSDKRASRRCCVFNQLQSSENFHCCDNLFPKHNFNNAALMSHCYASAISTLQMY